MAQTVRAGSKQVTRRSRLPWVLWLLAMVIGAVWFVMFHSSWFLATEIKISGTTRIDPKKIQNIAKDSLGQPLAALSGDTVRTKLSKLPEVKESRVERGWPHTILITVVERQPVALADTGKGFQLVDDLGAAAGPILTSAPSQFVVVTGTPGTSAMLSAVQVIGGLPKTWKVQSMSAATQDSVVVRLLGGVVVTFGSGDRVADKVKVAEALIANKYLSINVSSPDAPTVR